MKLHLLWNPVKVAWNILFLINYYLHFYCYLHYIYFIIIWIKEIKIAPYYVANNFILLASIKEKKKSRASKTECYFVLTLLKFEGRNFEGLDHVFCVLAQENLQAHVMVSSQLATEPHRATHSSRVGCGSDSGE